MGSLTNIDRPMRHIRFALESRHVQPSRHLCLTSLSLGPPVCFSSTLSILSIILSWMTYVYFPIAFDLDRRGAGLKFAVTAVTAIRLAMMALAVSEWHKSRGESREAPSDLV